MRVIRGRALLAALLLAVPLTLVGGTAQAAACSSSTSGVSMVVQFPDGHTEIGCAPGDPTSGLDALSKAGFPYTFPPGQNFNGFVCTLKAIPADKNCVKPNYWAYFHAKRGGSWVYSDLGAGSYDPKPGTVEGWRFESGTTGPTTKPPGGSSAAGGSGAGATQGTRGGGSTPSGGAATTASPGATGGTTPTASATASDEALAKAKAEVEKRQAQMKASASASPSATAASSDATAAASEVSSSQPDATDSSGGLPWWVGVLAVVVLAVIAGGVTAARRRA